MPRRVRFIVFLGVVAMLVLATGLSAGAAPEGDIQSKEAEIAAAQERLVEIRTEQSVAEAAYSDALYRMNQLSVKIQEADRDLDKAEDQLAAAQEDLENRASEVYKSGNVGFINVLVGSEDFSQFATRLDLWVRLLGEEKAEVEAVREAKNELEARKSELEAQRASRVEAVEEALANKERAAAAEADAEAYLNSLNGELQAAIQARQDRQAAAARAAAAEAAAKAAAEAASAETTSSEDVSQPEAPVAAESVPQPVPQPDLDDQQAAIDAAAAAFAAQQHAELAAERAAIAKRRAERKDAREAEREAAEEAAAQAAIEAEAAEQALAEKRAAKRAAERRAELQEEREALAAEHEARRAEREALAAERRIDRIQERRAEKRAAAASAAAAAAEVASAPPSAARSGGSGRVSGSGNAVVAEGQGYLGVPYQLGMCDPRRGMDCSCFTMLVYQEFGISLPDNPAAQYSYGTPVRGAPAAGDLLFWAEGGGGITHVGIAMGDGTTIHASVYAGEVVQGTPINSVPGYVGARRLL